MVTKPREVFGRDDDWRALVSFATDPRARATLGVVSGRRRQGKTFLLSALADAMGGFYYEGVEATETESLRMFGAALAAYANSPAPYSFATWDDALAALFKLASDRPLPLIIDEFPYLIKSSPSLPSLLQRAIDTHSSRQGVSHARILVCGSAMSVMGGLLSGNAPLRGRAGLELMVRPLDFRQSASFWGITDPRLAVMVHSIVGGTPAYRREFVRDDSPDGTDDFDDWVARAVLNPRVPLFREARYLLAEEIDVRDPALYHSVLAAVADGNATRGGIANYIGRNTADISHPLTVLEDSALLAREPDAFRTGRSRYRITEPLITFNQRIMRPQWHRLELGHGQQVWRDARQRVSSQILGPHFEELCRTHALLTGHELFDSELGSVHSGTVADPANRTRIEIDVVALAPATPGQPKRILALGEAKWGETMDSRHLDRLSRARDLLAAKGYDTTDTVLTCYSGSGFDPDIRTRDRTLLIDPDRLYGG